MDTSLDWLARAAHLPGKRPVLMALYLLQQADRLDRLDHLLLVPVQLRDAGFDRFAAYRACEALQEAGLITIARCKGRAPLVTVHI